MTARRNDETGRSTGQIRHFGKAKRWKPPTPFIMHPRELLESRAYRALTSPCRTLLDFLELEHMRHGGGSNGKLYAPYDQLERFCISRRDIRPSLDRLEAFGIISCTTHGRRSQGRSEASEYRLNWLPSFDGELPTNEFLGISLADILAFEEAQKIRRTARIARRHARDRGKLYKVVG